MSSLRALPRKDLIALIAGLCLCASVFAYGAYETYINNIPETIEIKVFETNVYYYPQFKGNLTQVLTWGAGKYYFRGTWTNQLIEDYTYRITYVHKGVSRPHLNLIIINWEEIN